MQIHEGKDFKIIVSEYLPHYGMQNYTKYSYHHKFNK